MKRILFLILLLPVFAGAQGVPTFTIKGGGGGNVIGGGITAAQRDSINRALDSINARFLGYVPAEIGKRLFSQEDEEKLDEVYARPGQDLSAYTKNTDSISPSRIPGVPAFYAATLSVGTVAVASRHLLFTPIAIIVNDAREIVGGASPSVTYSVKYGPSRTNPTGFILNSRTVNSTSGQAATPLATTSIPANSWIWVEVTSVGGTINDFGITLTYN